MQQTTYEILSREYPPLLSLAQLADLTGMSVRTFRNWLCGNRMPLPVVRLGGTVRVRLLDVALWIDEGLSKPEKKKRGRPKKTDVVLPG